MENHMVKLRSVNNAVSPQTIKLVNEKVSTKLRQRKSDSLIILNCVDVCVNLIFDVISKMQRLTRPTVSATQYLPIFVNTPPSHPASNAIVDFTMRQENATLAKVNTVQINIMRTRLNCTANSFQTQHRSTTLSRFVCEGPQIHNNKQKASLVSREQKTFL